MILHTSIIDLAKKEKTNLPDGYKFHGTSFTLGVSETLNNKDRILEASIINSPTCCGIAEFGHFLIPYGRGRGTVIVPPFQIINEFIRLWKIVFEKTVHVNSVFAYLPEEEKFYGHYRQLLDFIGFKPIYTFHNPNTNHRIVQYLWEKPDELKKT